MSLDGLGRALTTNAVTVVKDTGTVAKRFSRDPHISTLWAPLERKVIAGATKRYAREKRLIEMFSREAELHTPTLVHHDDRELLLVYKALELTDFVQIFRDPEISLTKKLSYLYLALQQLRRIHNTGETHGDPYLKNFFVEDGMTSEGVYTCDFEHQRTGPAPAITDILILTANAAKALARVHQARPREVFDVVWRVYGREVTFPFGRRDQIFFRARFGMDDTFFRHFGRTRLISA